MSVASFTAEMPWEQEDRRRRAKGVLERHSEPATSTSSATFGRVDAQPADQNDTVVALAKRPAKPYVEQYIDLPPKFLDAWVNNKPRHDAQNKIVNEPSVFVGMPLKPLVSACWVAATIYRGGRQDEGLAIWKPRVLAAATGVTERRLKQMFPTEGRGFLDAFLRRRSGRQYSPDGDGGLWYFDYVQPIDHANSLHVPAWWLHKAPIAEARDEARWVKRDWSPESPALLACLAIARVGKDFTTTTTYGKTGLATVAGITVDAMKDGLRDATDLGMLARSRRDGGNHPAANRLRLHPGDAMSEASVNGATLF